jgi:hypothetical protein
MLVGCAIEIPAAMSHGSKRAECLETGGCESFLSKSHNGEKYTKYEPHVWSRPSYLPGDTSETADYKVGPWIVTLENVVTEEEADLLIEWGETRGWELSTDGGDLQPDGTSESTLIEGRTSRQA